MVDTLSNVVDKFLNRKKRNSKLVVNLFKGNCRKGEKAVNHAFLVQNSIINVVDRTINNSDVQEAISAAIKESVRSYTRDKNKIIEIYQDFVNFIKSEYGIDIPIEFPPLFSSDFDRMMYIIKEFHESERDIAYLEDKLWISGRTIEGELAKLRSENGVSIMGQKITLHGIKRQRGGIEFESTVHPIFLALNLAQVIVILHGLKYMAENEAYKEYALKILQCIWNELSDYAKRKIKQEAGKLSIDLSWYEGLDSHKDNELFYLEKECCHEKGIGNIIYLLKNGKRCVIEFIGDDGKRELLNGCIVVGYNGDEVKVKQKGKKYIINSSSIIKAYEI